MAQKITRRFKSVSVPVPLVVAAERFVSGEDLSGEGPHGYISASGLIADAVRRRLEELRAGGT